MTDSLAPRSFSASDLLGGEDFDFVVNLYVALLDRWPDAVGLRRYLDLVTDRPERRVEILREVAGSDEATKLGTRVEFGRGTVIPPSPARTAAITATLRTALQNRQIEKLQEAVGLLGGAGFAGDLVEARDAALLFEFNALRREVREALAGGPGGPAAVEAVARLVADHSAGLVAAAEAKFDARLRALEAQLLALKAGG